MRSSHAATAADEPAPGAAEAARARPAPAGAFPSVAPAVRARPAGPFPSAAVTAPEDKPLGVPAAEPSAPPPGAPAGTPARRRAEARFPPVGDVAARPLAPEPSTPSPAGGAAASPAGVAAAPAAGAAAAGSSGWPCRAWRPPGASSFLFLRLGKNLPSRARERPGTHHPARPDPPGERCPGPLGRPACPNDTRRAAGGPWPCGEATRLSGGRAAQRPAPPRTSA